jgi:hypothetical protein
LPVGLVTNSQTGINLTGTFTGNGSGLSNVDALTLGGLGSGNFWQLGGNNIAGGQFIGSVNNQPMEIRVNGLRAMRFEPNTSGAPNVIGGSPANRVDPGIVGATIAGGSTNNIRSDSPWAAIGGGSGNSIQSNATYATIGGGIGNSNSGSAAVIAGGNYNRNTAFWSAIGGGYQNNNTGHNGTIAGGQSNTNSGDFGTIAGGALNLNSGYIATIGGGDQNIASGNYSFIGGGFANSASELYATVPGGRFNTASGFASFAAGYGAQAIHSGSFVWADGSLSGFSSTAANQFAVRATGGMLLAGDMQMGTDSTDYRHFQLGGGNSSGFLYGSYTYYGDGVHLGYNFYADRSGLPHVIHPGGGSSRITASYGGVVLAVGNINLAPNSTRLNATLSGVTVYGTFNNQSDRNAKQDFAPVNSSKILDKVLQLPLSEWSYKEDSATRHVGPMGQDFYSIFNIGTDEKHIAPIDEGGVALAAIQGLNTKLEEARKENASLKARLDALEEIVRNQKSN